MFALQAMRFKDSDKTYWAIKDVFFENREAFLEECNGDEQKETELMANMLYSLASNKNKTTGVYKKKEQDDFDEMIANAEYNLNDTIHLLDGEHLMRLFQAFSLMGTENSKWVLRKMEKHLVDLAEAGKLDTYQIATIFRAMHGMFNTQSFGKEETWLKLEPLIMEKINDFSTREISHIMHAYSFREAGNPDLHEAFVKRLHSEDKVHDFAALTNILYYMMFTDTLDGELWLKFVDSAIETGDKVTLPANALFAFKYAKLYINYNFPEWNIDHFNDLCWYAEAYNSTADSDFYGLKSIERQEFKAYLCNRLVVLPIVNLTMHNLIVLNFVFPKYKIAMQYFENHKTLSETGYATARQKLGSKLMRYEGWKVLDVTQNGFHGMGYRDQFFKDWLSTARDDQITSGVIPKEETYVYP